MNSLLNDSKILREFTKQYAYQDYSEQLKIYISIVLPLYTTTNPKTYVNELSANDLSITINALYQLQCTNFSYEFLLVTLFFKRDVTWLILSFNLDLRLIEIYQSITNTLAN